MVPRPPIVWKPITYGPKRRAEMAAYAKRHYGIDTWRLQGPHVIVEHYTASESFSSAWNSFASNAPDPELHELPGDCAHFIVDRDGPTSLATTNRSAAPTTASCMPLGAARPMPTGSAPT
jgi:hypothetical protein